MDDETTRLRALLKGIALPWKAQPTVVDGDEVECLALVLCPHGDDGDRDMVAEIDMGHGVECDDAHAALIVAAVNALPGLLDRVEAAERERDVLRAQQAPLLDAHDALVAAARAAGWTGAGATGAELVAWVRRGATQEARNVEAPKVRALRTAINALCNVRTLRATCAEGETWRAHVHDKDWTDARTNALAVLNATGGE